MLEGAGAHALEQHERRAESRPQRGDQHVGVNDHSNHRQMVSLAVPLVLDHQVLDEAKGKT